ncbi:uncharacterized protein LOC130732032 [Lotus japonicus]|uniref:uncharacterized protein LOC130732032 n=1 Tax=Lotus japonicus TaxID=34305 RepID=UPI0025858F1E|nr:uncharacterized protein LOC130732032 [Lotus japonicus]
MMKTKSTVVSWTIDLPDQHNDNAWQSDSAKARRIYVGSATIIGRDRHGNVVETQSMEWGKVKMPFLPCRFLHPGDEGSCSNSPQRIAGGEVSSRAFEAPNWWARLGDFPAPPLESLPVPAEPMDVFAPRYVAAADAPRDAETEGSGDAPEVRAPVKKRQRQCGWLDE